MIYHRFTRSERTQHWLLFSSFAVLAVTGLPQMSPDQSLSAFVIRALGGIEAIRISHRVAAVALMLVCIWHLVEVLHKLWVRRVPLGMLPRVQDARDALATLAYNLGRAGARPLLDRYTFEEKVEYWALVWGTVLMVITGFLLWNPIAATAILPGQIIPAARAAHAGEAILAVLSIFVWHLYGVLVRRVNKSMITGHLTEKEMEEEHPIELARIRAGVAYGEQSAAVLKRRQRAFIPVAAVLAALLLAGLAFFVTFEQTAIDVIPPR